MTRKTDYVGAELKNIVASHSNIALDEINTVIEYEEMTKFFCVWQYGDSFMVGISLWRYQPYQYDTL